MLKLLPVPNTPAAMAAPVSGMKKEQLRAELDALGVEYFSKDNVPILTELLKESRARLG